jgi:uncharacterized protein (DUF2062 family)
VSWVRRQIDRLRNLWHRALEENATPAKFAWAVALGAFVSAGPFYGARSVLSGFAAWPLRLNKLTAILASHILSGPLAFIAIFYEVRLGSAILGRPLPPLQREMHQLDVVLDFARHALLAWIVGALVVAPFFALLAGLIAYPIAKRYHARKLARRGPHSTPPAPTAEGGP